MAPTDNPKRARPRILVSAYACGPGEEPEAGAGWAFARAAAVDHDVWVITRERFRPAIEAALADEEELASHLTVVHLDLSDRVMRRLKRSWDVYWYYCAWQRALVGRARSLHQDVGFDLVHHVTFANDWLPCGAAELTDIPLVWGPVGGASRVPLRHLARWLGVRGTVTEIVRTLAVGLARRRWGDHAAKRAALVVAQNADVAQRFRGSRKVVIEPNAAFDIEPPPSRETRSPGTRAVFVGRLLAWKGSRLAVAALARPQVQQWTLDIYGTGPQRKALERLARRLGIEDRVTFRGHRPRSEVLAAMADADAFLFPSMHDQAGWVAGEASAQGIPVVCLPLGGPPLMAGPNARVPAISSRLADGLADALRGAGVGHPYPRWSPSRLPALVTDWYGGVLHPADPSTPD